MRITNVRAIAHAAPGGDFRGDGRNYVYVKVETDGGVLGWGEATCGSLAVTTMVDELARILVGEDPFTIERHWQRLYHFGHNLRGGIVHMAALSGIDAALWDLKARALGVPLYQLLGGKLRDRLWCYGRFDGPTPEAATARARRERARGFTALKGDPFRHRGPHLTPEAERAAVDILRAVRDEVGPDVELLIEAHGRLSVASATRFLHAVSDIRPFFIEEPLVPEDIEGLALLSRRTDVPIAVGERILTKWGARSVLESGGTRILQPDPAHAGGVTEIRKIAALAEAFHCSVQLHNPYGPINTLVAAHLGACLPNFLIMEVILEQDMHNWFDRVVTGRFPAIAGGTFAVPDQPGLGVDLDEAALAAHPPVPESSPSGYVRHAGIASPQGIDWT